MAMTGAVSQSLPSPMAGPLPTGEPLLVSRRVLLDAEAERRRRLPSGDKA
jgi:hypothetical protein